ncbi:hypothetical protein MAHJHV50_12230 [Mycobacterium avium subsp. hominissuis]
MVISSQPGRSADRRRYGQHRHAGQDRRRDPGANAGQYQRQPEADVGDHVEQPGQAAAQALRRGGLTGLFYVVTYIGFGLPLILASVRPGVATAILSGMAVPA